MLEKLTRTVSHYYNKYGAAGFTCAAIVAVVVEGVTAYRAGKKIGQNPNMDTKDKILTVLPAAGSGIVAASCAIASQSKNAGQISALVSQTILDKKKSKATMEKVEEFIGKDNMDKFKASFHPDVEIEPMKIDVGEFLFVDDQTGARVVRTLEEMQEARYQFMMEYMRNGTISHGRWLEIAGFNRFGKGDLPQTFDCEGKGLLDLSDEDVGYSVTKFLEYGYETGAFDIDFVRCVNSNDEEYYLVDFKEQFSADYLNY